MEEVPRIVTLQRDVTATVVPVGTPVTLQRGEQAHITQALGGSYTVVVNGNMFHIDGQDADALGLERPREAAAPPAPPSAPAPPRTVEEVEKAVWEQLKTCYDPEIPVNIVDLGLVYDVAVSPLDNHTYRVEVKMTLTAPGCGMGPMIQQDAEQKILAVDGVAEARVELVWDPPWNQDMLTDAAKLELGLM